MPTRLRRAVACVTVSLAGCAINPYIDDPRPSASEGRPQLDAALVYADNLHRSYYKKHSEEFLRERNLAGGLLTLATAGLLAAYGGAHSDVLVGLAAGGALAYQLGTWNTNRARVDIYMEGMKAVSCARTAIAPLNLPPEYLVDVVNVRTLLEGAVQRGAAAAGELEQIPLSGEAQQKANKTLAEFARAELQAREAAGRAASLQRKVNGAGSYLSGQLDTIHNAVTEAINGTRADLRNLPVAITAIAAHANSLEAGMIGGLRSKTTTSGQASNAESLTARGARASAPYARLTSELSLVQMYTRQLEEMLPARTAEELKGELVNCNVDASRIAKLRATPSSVEIAQGDAGVRVQVLGGTTPYAVEPSGALANGLTIGPDTSGFSIAAAANATVATQRVRVRDAANNEVVVDVQVKSAVPTKESTGQDKTTQGGASTTAPACFKPATMPRELTCFIQHSVGAKVDGDFGSETCARYRADTRLKDAGGRVNDQAVALLAKQARIPEKPSVEDLRAYLGSLGLTQQCGPGR